MTLWFSADFHFGHTNIIRYCGRPFANTHEMNKTIIENWNQCVRPDDYVIFLGDFALMPLPMMQHIFEQLNGKHFTLIHGNHDKSKNNMLLTGFDEVHDYMDFKRDGLKVFLSHVPMTSAYHDLVLCGHSHGAFKINGNILNVGVDVWDFKPVSWDEIKRMKKEGLLERQSFVPMEIPADGES